MDIGLYIMTLLGGFVMYMIVKGITEAQFNAEQEKRNEVIIKELERRKKELEQEESGE